MFTMKACPIRPVHDGVYRVLAHHDRVARSAAVTVENRDGPAVVVADESAAPPGIHGDDHGVSNDRDSAQDGAAASPPHIGVRLGVRQMATLAEVWRSASVVMVQKLVT